MTKTVAVIEKMENGYGVSLPDFPTAGNVGATVEEALANAEVTLDAHIDGVTRYGGELPTRMRSIDEIMADPDHLELIEEVGPVAYAMIDVPVQTKTVRLSITMDENLVERIDRTARATGESRSGFLAAAARARLAG
jgi:predicted RNase H-like HicB family nuclease